MLRCILSGIAMQSLQITRNILFEKIYYDEQQIYFPSFQTSRSMYCTIPLFQLSFRWEKCGAARRYVVIGKQLAISNDRNRVRWAVLGWESTDSFENFSVKSSKRDQSNYIRNLIHLCSHWSIPLWCPKKTSAHHILYTLWYEALLIKVPVKYCILICCISDPMRLRKLCESCYKSPLWNCTCPLTPSLSSPDKGENVMR